MSFRRIAGAVVFTLCALVPVMAAAQTVPREAYKAKTIWIENRTGKAAIENGADAAIAKWGRFTLADDADSADIRLVIAKQGSTSTQTETPSDTGAGSDRNFSTSFTFGTIAWAYLKGQKLYFWTTGGGSGEKGGKGIVEDFRKLFPRN